MQVLQVLSIAGIWLDRLLCRMREARRLRRSLDELALMSAHQLRDIGISHASVAAAARRTSCCA